MSTDARLIELLCAEMVRHAPFAQMPAASLQALVGSARQTYYAPGERVLQPEDGPVRKLLWIRRGAVSGRAASSATSARASSAGQGGGFQLEAGEMFPIGALLARRAVSSVYEAVDDLFCLEFDADVARGVVARDAVLADFMNRSLQHVLALSQSAVQGALASRVLQQHAFDAPLSQLPRRAPVAVSPQAPLREALSLMQQRGVGSVLALDEQGRAVGILTRHDLLPKIALREPPLDIASTPLSALMSTPVRTLPLSAAVQDAALLMSRYGIRHVPLTEREGEVDRVVSLVSERDLFALQRRSIRQLGSALREAPDVDTLRTLAREVREFAQQLMAQGVASRSLTQLVSHLNDELAARMVALFAQAHALDLSQACWVAFGSEGRGEQTIATDQDNGLVLDDALPEPQRERWRAMAAQVNEALDACGYPLCKGGIMAGQSACCLTQSQWRERFTQWMGRAEPEDLLAASIYFDLRAVAGEAALAQPLRALVDTQAARHPRFLRAMAENSLRLKPALNWHGGLDAQESAGRRFIDIKLHGTALFVDAARLLALAHGVPDLGTRERLLKAGAAAGASERERETWVGAFEVLQMLRLRAQIDADAGVGDAAPPRGLAATAAGWEASPPQPNLQPALQPPLQPNHVDLDRLHDIDRRLLKEALRVARLLQQRIEMEWLA